MAGSRNVAWQKSRFLLYPAAVRATQSTVSTSSKDEQRTNPRLLGWGLLVFAFLIDNIVLVQRLIWQNAGFGVLAKMGPLLTDIEPRYDPTVIPIADEEALPEGNSHGIHQDPVDINSLATPNSVAQYRALYISQVITPTAVADVLLALLDDDKHSAACVEIRPELIRKSARESTMRYSEGRPLSQLDGILVAVKDEFDVKGHTTRIGSRLVPHVEKTVDSWCVEKLREAGAIIIGKVTMVEFGLDTSGINPNFGTPLSPYNSQYYAGGSSSGSAYFVSTGLVPLALGTDAGGSIRIPASFCSATGLLATHGRLSFMPGINHVSTTSIGGIAADIDSLSAFYSIISQPHPTSMFPKSPPIDLQHNISSEPRVIGIPEAWFQRATPAIQELCRRIIERLETSKDYKVVPVDIPFMKEGQLAASVTVLAEAATVIPKHSGLTAPVRILLALGRFTPAIDFIIAQKLRHLLMQHLAWLWSEHGHDMIIVTPTTSCAGWRRQSATELKHGLSDANRTMECMENTWLASFCGLPSISMPAGYVVPEGGSAGAMDAGEIASEDREGKIPVGIMATGEWAAEETLMRFAKDVEDVCRGQWSRPPAWVDVAGLAKEEMEKKVVRDDD
ncbi:glutamyl-tRNA amidotransferase subunit A [Xylariaceae sp. FL1272]|nr:glutamyl-tRNA amidotransferase subunit A [Xylariaceae sp. FL1272]